MIDEPLSCEPTTYWITLHVDWLVYWLFTARTDVITLFYLIDWLRNLLRSFHDYCYWFEWVGIKLNETMDWTEKSYVVIVILYSFMGGQLLKVFDLLLIVGSLRCWLLWFLFILSIWSSIWFTFFFLFNGWTFDYGVHDFQISWYDLFILVEIDLSICIGPIDVVWN